MEQQRLEQALIRKYLLKDLDENGQENLEQRLLTDEEFLEEVSIAQSELVDEYLSDSLSAAERQNFEKHFLSTPRRLQKLQMARSLDRYLEERAGPLSTSATTAPHFPIPTRRNLTIVLSLAAVVALLMGGYVVTEVIKRRISNDKIIEAQKRRAALESELADLNHSTNGSPQGNLAVLPLTLKPILVREAGEIRNVDVFQSRSLIVLQLELTADTYESYQASLQTNDDVELAAVYDLKTMTLSNGKLLMLKLPAWLIEPGDYQVRLRGVLSGQQEDVGLFPFRITRK
ncbi:MAG TPA: hypothetical protein VNG71_11495 [Pyrinomonadaceae bacterium]|nr:hypothetical protein [Pyrinomonadaceae bacterium]